MADDATIWHELLKAAAASATVTAALWGAAGGATSALVVKVSAKDVLRHVTLGALTAGGIGTMVGAVLLAKTIGVTTEALGYIGAGSSISYLVGVFGPAIMEVLLHRIRRGQLPGEDRADDQ